MIVVSEHEIIEIRCYFDCILYTKVFDMEQISTFFNITVYRPLPNKMLHTKAFERQLHENVPSE